MHTTENQISYNSKKISFKNKTRKHSCYSQSLNILLVIILLANCGYGSLAVSCTMQLLFGGCVCVLNQQIALSEFPMGRFLVPPQHATLSKIQMGRFLCNKPVCCLVRITKGAIFCAKLCQNSQWADAVCQTMSEFQLVWFCTEQCQNSQWGDSVCQTSTPFCQNFQWGDSVCQTMSEFSMWWFCVPNHVRIPNGVILCAEPCQNPQCGDYCAKPAHRFVRITNGVILCAKPCQNSQWIVHTVHTELDQNISSVAKPIALHQTIGRFSFLDSIGLGHILEF